MLDHKVKSIISNYSLLNHEISIRESELQKREARVIELSDSIKIQTITRDILVELSKKLHSKSQTEVSKFVTRGLETIFGDKYRFVMDTKTERNKASVEFKVYSPQGVELDPRTEVGGGIMDSIAMLLRFIIWLLSPNKTRPVFILDEPMKYLSSDYLNRASIFLQQLATNFDLQIYMNTHEPELMDIGKRLHFKLDGQGVSYVKQYNEEDVRSQIKELS